MTDLAAGGSPVRTVFLGSGTFAVPALHVVDAHPDTQLVAVVTAAARPAGRGRPLAHTPVEVAARAAGIEPILTPARLRSPEAIREVLDLRADLLVLADYGQIVPAALLDAEHGALNLHPSLLPRHRGATPVASTILAGDQEAGATVIRMDAGLDTGPIVAQVRRPLAGTETTPELEAVLAEAAAELLGESLGPWIGGRLRATAQPEIGATVTRRLHREDGRLDPRSSAEVLERQVRAYQPWPGSFVDTSAGRLVIWSASAEQGARATPGSFDAGGLCVGSGERLRLTEVQPAGGRRMSWDAFLRGHPAIPGGRVVEPGS